MSEFEIINIAGLSMLETVRKRIIRENLKTQGEILSYLDKFIKNMEDILNGDNPDAERLYNILSL